MKKIITCILIAVCLSCPAFAQRDLPVSGHAATLVDLLKKDYNAIDPDNRKEEISRDRTLIISIFKSYLKDEDKSELENNTNSDQKISLENVTLGLSQRKKEYTDYLTLSSSSNLKEPSGLKEASEKIETISKNLDTAKQKYYSTKFILDDSELSAIGERYCFTGNTFLKYVIELFQKKYERIKNGNLDKFSTTNPSSEIQKSIPFIGGNLAFETAMDGLAKFLAKRLKQELTTYVIERVKVWLQDPSQDDPFAEFKVLLPKTTNFLIGFTADKVTNFPNEIKQYIEDDLDHILDNAHNLRNAPRIQKLISNNPDLDFALEALETIPNISKIKSPTDYFIVLEKSRNLYRWKTDTSVLKHNIANAIYLTGLLARSLSVNENGETKLASINFLGTYAIEKNFFLLYTGFIRQQNLKYYNLSFRKHDGKDTLFSLEKHGLGVVVKKDPSDKSQNKDLPSYENLVDEVLVNAAKNAEKIYNIGQDIKKANQAGKAIGADTIYNFVDNVIGFSEELTVSADSLINKLITDHNRSEKTTFDKFELKTKIAPYFTIAHTSNEIMKDLSHKKYATALLKAIEIGSNLNSQDTFPQFVSTFQKLRFIVADNRSIFWHKFIEMANKDTGVIINLDREDIDALKNLNAEVTRLILFYRINYQSVTLNENLETLRKLCNTGALTSLISKSALDSVKNVFDNVAFQKLLLSYSINVPLDEYLANLKGGMTKFKVNGTHVFSDDDAQYLVSTATQYLTALFKNYYLEGRKDEGEDLIKMRDILFSTISGYLTVLPQKFDIGANKNLVSLIHFINDMALAKTSDDVEKAIDAFALPAGSYAIKRQSQFNFTINSYPGVLFAGEVSLAKEALSVAFTAPVGLGLSWGSKRGDVDGIFIPVIDIGALTRLRLDNSAETKSLPEFNFKNIFSPGIYYSHGFRKSPLAINIGVQYGPELDAFKEDGTILFKKDVFRFGVGLVFDIPLLNLQTRPR